MKGENIGAIQEGCKNLAKHIENIDQFGVPVTVAINEYYTDTKEEHQAILDFCADLGVTCKISSHWSDGGKGAADLAIHISELVDSKESSFKTLYDDDMSLWDKTRYIARNIYGAEEILADKKSEINLLSLKKKDTENTLYVWQKLSIVFY